MSVFSSLNVGVTALQAQSNAIALISQNISNANTTGYKAGLTDFTALLDTASPAFNDATSYSPGGVMSSVQQLNDVEGSIVPTSSSTDVAIAGDGFFAVSPSASNGSPSEVNYTRNGSFTPDADGNYVNTSGEFLQAYALDANGNLPAGFSGADVSSGTAIANLQTVNIQDVTADPVATTAVTIQANLLSSQAAYSGTPAYNAADPTANMASGSIAPDFTVPVSVIDNQGDTHTLTAGFLKTGTNSWAMEIYASPASDVSAPSGQLASGTVTFNGDGTLASISPALTQPLTADWTTSGSSPSTITYNLGTAGAIFGTPGATVIGRADGLQQLDGSYNVQTAAQNGSPAGTGASVAISSTGLISVTYTDGVTRNLYQIPLAQFQNPDQLQQASDNLYSATEASGSSVFFTPGTGESAILDTESLESSNVDTATELTNMIIAQNAYEANSKLITTSDSMLQVLTQMDQAVPD